MLQPRNFKGLDLSQLSLETLEGIEGAVEAFTLKEKPSGEPWHPSYKKNRKLFKKLIRLTVKFRRSLSGYFLDQYSRLGYYLRLPVIRADEADDYITQIQWDEENRTLAAVLEINLGDLFAIGARVTEMELQTDLNIGPTHTEEAKFLRRYSVELAGEITQTTKKRITQQIRTSIELGETREQLAGRIDKVLNNPNRARMIAQTESIRAYAEGRMAVGRRLGIGYKQWQSFQVDRNEICGQINGDVVPLEQPFKNGLFAPAGHPNCRCSLKLLYTNPYKEEGQDDGAQDPIDRKTLFDSAR
jgi:hypothetical protein